jgi:hypothetical protein
MRHTKRSLPISRSFADCRNDDFADAGNPVAIQLTASTFAPTRVFDKAKKSFSACTYRRQAYRHEPARRICFIELSTIGGAAVAEIPPHVRGATPMPDKTTLARARRDKREGKSRSTQAGEFVREEIEHVREGKHGARSARQAIAIGLSKARRAGIDVPRKGTSKKKSASRKRTTAAKRGARSAKRSAATKKALRREGHSAASRKSLSRQARSAASKRSAASRSAAARKAARTKGARGRSAAARKAARTRARRSR